MTEIPVPPFADFASAQSFHEKLMSFTRQANSWHAPVEAEADGISCRECESVYPCRTALRLALASRFPVRWTPAELIAAMKAVSLLAPDYQPNPSTTSFLLINGDPIIAAELEPKSGNWVIIVSERGKERLEFLDDDAAFIERLRYLGTEYR